MKKNIIKFLILCIFASNLNINSIKSVTDDTKLGLEVGIPIAAILIPVALFIKMLFADTAAIKKQETRKYSPSEIAENVKVARKLLSQTVSKSQQPILEKAFDIVEQGIKNGQTQEQVISNAASKLATALDTPITTPQLTAAVDSVSTIEPGASSASVIQNMIQTAKQSTSSESSRVDKPSVGGETGSLAAALKSISSKEVPKGPLVSSTKLPPAVVIGGIKLAIGRKLKAFISGQKELSGKDISKINYSSLENSLKAKADGKLEESTKEAALFIKTFLNDFNLPKDEAFSILSDFMNEFLIKENNLDVMFVKEVSSDLGQEVSETLGLLVRNGADLKDLADINNRIVEKTFSKPHIEISEQLQFETPLDFSDALAAMKSQKSMRDINALEHKGSVYLISKDPHTGISFVEKQISGSTLDPNLKIAKYEPTIKQFQRVNEPTILIK